MPFVDISDDVHAKYDWTLPNLYKIRRNIKICQI